MAKYHKNLTDAVLGSSCALTSRSNSGEGTTTMMVNKEESQQIPINDICGKEAENCVT